MRLEVSRLLEIQVVDHLQCKSVGLKNLHFGLKIEARIQGVSHFARLRSHETFKAKQIVATPLNLNHCS